MIEITLGSELGVSNTIWEKYLLPTISYSKEVKRKTHHIIVWGIRARVKRLLVVPVAIHTIVGIPLQERIATKGLTGWEDQLLRDGCPLGISLGVGTFIMRCSSMM